jgi:hypothetical protein
MPRSAPKRLREISALTALSVVKILVISEEGRHVLERVELGGREGERGWAGAG